MPLGAHELSSGACKGPATPIAKLHECASRPTPCVVSSVRLQDGVGSSQLVVEPKVKLRADATPIDCHRQANSRAELNGASEVTSARTWAPWCGRGGPLAAGESSKRGKLRRASA